MKRRAFIKTTLVSVPALKLAAAGLKSLVVDVRGPDVSSLVEEAFKALGGIEKFVTSGQTVLVKPNIGWDRPPETAANTNPEVVAGVVSMCKKAGAKRVIVLDRTCNNPMRCYNSSGIEAAARGAGATVRHIVEGRFRDTAIPGGQILKMWPIYKDALDADLFINLPVAKTHAVSGLTLGFKNIMGVLGGNRGEIHTDFETKIVDLFSAIRPALTIIDATRILVRNGPTGGNPADVEKRDTLIASADTVAADSYAATLFDIDRSRLEYLQIACDRGLGESDLSRITIKQINLTEG